MRKIKKVFSEVEGATTNSAVYNILGAKRVTLLCKRGEHSSGSSTFSAEVGVAGSLATYKRWVSNATNTNVQETARVDELALSSDSVDFISMSPEDIFEEIKIKVVRNTDGESSAWLITDYADDLK